MNISRLGALALTAGAALAVAGCTDDYGGGYGYARPSGYGSYGYGGYYGDPYAYDDYYDGYYGYGSPWFGWYGDYYYPGIGFYVYDRGGNRYRWNDRQRQYWMNRRGNGYTGAPNWSGYRNPNGRANGTGTYTGRQGNGTGTANGGGTYSGRTWNGGGATTGGGAPSGRSWGGHRRH